MKYISNPFFWGFSEQRSIETLAKQAKATYNTPRETLENKTALESFFDESFGVSSNPAFITGATALENPPYLTPQAPTTPNEIEDCEEEDIEIN